jgi:hypothetical protein
MNMSSIHAHELERFLAAGGSARRAYVAPALLGIVIILAAGCDKKSASPDAPNESGGNLAQVGLTPQKSLPASPTSQPTASGARWSSKEMSYNCGDMWAGNIRQHKFEYLNTGTDTLEILEAKPGCYCSTATNMVSKVPPARSGRFTYRLDTSGKLGHIDETITLVTNDSANPYMVFHMTGEVKLFAEQEVIYDSSLPGGGDAKTLEPLRKKLATFDAIKPDSHLKRILRIRNTSGQSLALSLLPMFPAKTPFKVELKETKAGEEYELTVLGEPPYQGGVNKAVASFKTNIKGMPTFVIPIYATIPQRVEVVPTKIVVDPGLPVVLDRYITITHDGSRPFKIMSLETTEQSFDLRLLPQNPTKPNQWVATLRLPDSKYRPPPYGEVVRFYTTDDEQAVIDIYVLPTMGLEAAERPPSKPMVFQPGIMPAP